MYNLATQKRNGVLRKDLFDIMDNIFKPLYSNDEMRFVKMYETKNNEDNYEIELEVPGFDESTLDITVEKRMLIINGKIDNEKSSKIREINKIFSIPEDVNLENISANVKNGILNVTLYKKEEATPKKIEVKNK